MNRFPRLACWQILAGWALAVAVAGSAHAQAAGASAPVGTTPAQGAASAAIAGADVQPVSDSDAAKAALLAKALSDTSRMVAMKPFQSREEIERFFDVRLTHRLSERNLQTIYEGVPAEKKWFRSIEVFTGPVVESKEKLTAVKANFNDHNYLCGTMPQFSEAWGIPPPWIIQSQGAARRAGAWYHQFIGSLDVNLSRVQIELKNSYTFHYSVFAATGCIREMVFILN